MNFTKISSVLSIGSTLFAFYGMLKMILFYKLFYVDILYFVTLSDLLTASLDGIFYGFLFFFPLAIILTLTIREKPFNNPPETFLQLFKQQPLFMTITFFIQGAVYSIVCSSIYEFMEESFLPIFLLFFIVTSFFAPAAINKIVVILRKEALNLKQRVIIFSFVYIGVLYMGIAFSDAEMVSKDYYHDLTNVYFNDGSNMLADSTNFYIGNTSQYLFIHDKESLTTSMYSIKDIKKIDF